MLATYMRRMRNNNLEITEDCRLLLSPAKNNYKFFSGVFIAQRRGYAYAEQMTELNKKNQINILTTNALF